MLEIDLINRLIDIQAFNVWLAQVQPAIYFLSDSDTTERIEAYKEFESGHCQAV